MFLTCYKTICKTRTLNIMVSRKVSQLFDPQPMCMKILGPPLYWNPGFIGFLHPQRIIPIWFMALRLVLIEEQCMGHLSLPSRSTQVSGGYGRENGQVHKSEFDGGTSNLVWSSSGGGELRLYIEELALELSFEGGKTVTRQAWGSGMNLEDSGTRSHLPH